MKRSAYTALCAQLLFPLHERLKGHDSVAWRRRLETSQWWTPAQLQAHRLQRLRSFLADVQAHVPFHRQRMAEAGLEPAELGSLDDLQRLPLLTKADIRAHADALKADNAGMLSRYNTGGSSGEPLVFYIGKDRKSHDVASKWRATRWWDVDIGDPELVIWGSPVELGAQDRLRQWRDRIMRSELLPAFEMSEAKVDGFLATLRRFRPRMLFGYPSALTHIAQQARRRGVALDDLGVKVAFVTSERLYDDQREVIASTFGCRVANGYGGRDAGFLAHECPHGGMHITAEDIILELTAPDGRCVPLGEPGEVTVTHMATRDFPFIRYRTGDIAVMDERRCACGRGLPMLKEIQGRTTDFVVAADGTVMHGLSLIYVIRDLPGVRAFRVEQESLEFTRVLLVTDDGFDAGAIGLIERGFRSRLGQGVQVQVERVAHIPPERSGKFRYVVSRVAPAGAGAAGPG